jgi:type IV pilus assembly protein PilE
MRIRATAPGFSLVELLTVITILGIVSAIAMPAMHAHLRSARRAEATGALLRIAVRQEQFMLRHRRYAHNAELAVAPPEGLGFDARLARHYVISVGAHATGYIASAQVVADGAQSRDSQCWSLYLDATGAQSARDEYGRDTTRRCWK